MLVMVYGTLKAAHGNHRVLGSKPDFVGEAVTKEALYTMYDGGFPYVTDDGVSRIRGELYSVDDEQLGPLDRLEGFPTHYGRDLIPVIVDGEEYSAWMYTASEDVKAILNRGNRDAMQPDEDNIVEWR